eukprot:6405-Heterococcus_DN1.PRE.1
MLSVQTEAHTASILHYPMQCTAANTDNSHAHDRAAHLRRELALELAEQHADIAAAAAVGDANGGYSYNITIQSTVVTGSLDSVHDIRGALEADWRAMDVK